MSVNINAFLDRAEDPEKMIDEYMRDIEADLGKVKAETASVMAAQKRAQRELDEKTEEIAKMQRCAEKALMAGNEGDARAFLAKKSELSASLASLQQNYDLAKANADKMKGMHDKLVKDMSSLQARRAAIKSKMAVAKTQERMNKLGAGAASAGAASAGETMSAFDKMEEKANRMLDEAEALSELNAPKDGGIDDLMSKYDDEGGSSSAVDDELAALKAKMGL